MSFFDELLDYIFPTVVSQATILVDFSLQKGRVKIAEYS